MVLRELGDGVRRPTADALDGVGDRDGARAGGHVVERVGEELRVLVGEAVGGQVRDEGDVLRSL